MQRPAKRRAAGMEIRGDVVKRMLSIVALMLSICGWVVDPLLVGSAARAEPVSFYGTVYDDRNRNGVFDAGDVALPGVTVNLFDAVAGAVMASQVTAGDGSYNFTVDEQLPSHNYAIFVAAAGGLA